MEKLAIVTASRTHTGSGPCVIPVPRISRYGYLHRIVVSGHRGTAPYRVGVYEYDPTSAPSQFAGESSLVAPIAESIYRDDFDKPLTAYYESGAMFVGLADPTGAAARNEGSLFVLIDELDANDYDGEETLFRVLLSYSHE